ncbi:hypothetical protein L9F63_023230 [Diploptera punctata]|uniref:Major facilitator superfamily (MFS) profile domain-containing protein n=1 Tax=Diploptera punctata TaxID=6984 RepID=A0AAD7ZJN2_DIPPU|nr:hypothetical protein L9F63_023230 [Diploptera punctata]
MVEDCKLSILRYGTNATSTTKGNPPPSVDFTVSNFLMYTVFQNDGRGFKYDLSDGMISSTVPVYIAESAPVRLRVAGIFSTSLHNGWRFDIFVGHLPSKSRNRLLFLYVYLSFTFEFKSIKTADANQNVNSGKFVLIALHVGVASMSVPVYIAESASPTTRGRLVTINTILITGGQFVSSIICGAFSSHPDGWRYMLGLAALPACIQFFGFLGMPESPRWLVSKKRYDEALKVLKSIRGEDFPVQEELDTIKESCLVQEAEITERQRAGGSSSLCLQILTTKSVRRALFLGCLLQGIQQLAGINTVMYYSASIIQMAGVKDYSVAIWLSCATSSVNFFCTFIGLCLVERIGRRPLTLWSLGGVVISLIILGIGFRLMTLDAPPVIAGEDIACHARTCTECIDAGCGFCYWDGSSGVSNGSCWSMDSQTSLATSGICGNKTYLDTHPELTWADGWCPSEYSWVAVAALAIYLLFFAPGMGPMPWTINSEIYPMWARSSCNSVATSTNWMFNLLISMTFLTLTEVLTKEGAFYLYAGLAFVGLVSLIFLLPETKGKTLEEMETVFSGPWCMTFNSKDSKNVHEKNIDYLNTPL